jgi:lipoyl(octanoyl) transferase
MTVVNDSNGTPDEGGGAGALSAYLLGRPSLDSLIALQRRLVYEVEGDRDSGAVIICEHPACITIGREGSRLHIRTPPETLTARGLPVHWLGRGGGAMLHLPGQVACYPIVALDRVGCTPARYLAELRGIVTEVLRDYTIPMDGDGGGRAVRVGGRSVAHVSAAVHDWVTCFGIVLNVHPDLEPFHEVQCDGEPAPMTSMHRESGSRVRAAAVRQRLLELVASRFGFSRVSVFHTPQWLEPRPSHHAASTGTR